MTSLIDETYDQVGEQVAPAAAQPEHRSVALSRPLIITGLILATALSALEGTIVATAMPTIVGVLGGLPLYSLVISVYLLTATTLVPLYGKLSDMYGRKPIFMLGVGLFIFGSALCGLAWDMPSLIAFRAIQGLGAGAVLPISLTIIGDLFELEERARLQGVFGAVWGVSGILGPLVGGAIVQHTDWRWVFLINVPVGIVSALLIFFYLREPKMHTRQRIDIAGAVTLTLGVGMLLMVLQSSGHGGWLSTSTLLLMVGTILLLALFVWVEKRAVAPVLSLDLLSRRIIAVPCLVGILAHGVLVGFAAYVPLLSQGAWGSTPIEAGLIIAPLSVGWPLASALSGRFIRRFGYRPVTLVGVVTVLAGTLLLLSVQFPFVSANLNLRVAAVLIGSMISGLGFGMSSTAMLIAVQTSVAWKERGAATGAVMFSRSMGYAVGASALGAILTASLSSIFATERLREAVSQMPAEALKAGSDPTLGPVNALFDLNVRDTLPPPVRAALADALASSLWWVLVGIVLFAVVGTLIATRFPKRIEGKT